MLLFVQFWSGRKLGRTAMEAWTTGGSEVVGEVTGVETGVAAVGFGADDLTLALWSVSGLVAVEDPVDPRVDGLDRSRLDTHNSCPKREKADSS